MTAKRKPVQPSGEYWIKNADGSGLRGDIFLGKRLYLREGDWLARIISNREFMIETVDGQPVWMVPSSDYSVSLFTRGEIAGARQLKFRRLRRGG